jgi:hypothetical protein
LFNLDFQDVAAYIKKEFDKKYNPTWYVWNMRLNACSISGLDFVTDDVNGFDTSSYSRHVIVGRNFGSYVTHETKHFIYFYLGQVAVLLFKSG